MESSAWATSEILSNTPNCSDFEDSVLYSSTRMQPVSWPSPPKRDNPPPDPKQLKPHISAAQRTPYTEADAARRSCQAGWMDVGGGPRRSIVGWRGGVSWRRTSR